MNRYVDVLDDATRKTVERMGDLARKLEIQKAQPLLPEEKLLIRSIASPRMAELFTEVLVEFFVKGKDAADSPQMRELLQMFADLKD